MFWKSNAPLTQQVKKLGIEDFTALQNFVRHLPYGRNANRTDFGLVLSEHRGTCSSKHAFLKKVAEENQFSNVKLLLGIYKMSEKNTPKIGNELSKNDLKYIPEAHCYLKIQNTRIDLTNATSDIQNIEKDILKELEILPEQVINFKIQYHQNYLKNWLKKEKLKRTFEDIWKIREQCIKNLST